MKQSVYILLFFGICITGLTTCKQPDNNPCAGAKEPTAAFTMMEVDPYYFGFTTYDTDTASPNEIQFTANETNAKYEWKIGTDTVFYTKQQFSLNFSNYYTQYYPNVPPITVTLKVTKNPGSCFPASDSVKYMTRTLYLNNNSLVNGSFKGRFNFDTTIRTFTVLSDTIKGGQNCMLIMGLPNKDTLFIDWGDETEITFYRKVLFNFVNSPTVPPYHLEKGEFMVSGDGQTAFLWMTQNSPNLPAYYTFTGEKIH